MSNGLRNGFNKAYFLWKLCLSWWGKFWYQYASFEGLAKTWYWGSHWITLRGEGGGVSHAIIGPIIKEREYIPIYLPYYSPELNPIEMVWKVLKDRVKRSKLSDVETLTSRVIKGSEDVPVEHLQNFIQHSINVFTKCINKEALRLLLYLIRKWSIYS